MGKTRFGQLDIRRAAAEVNAQIGGFWVNNIYDVDARTFLIKLTLPGREKELLVIESGVRFHTSKYVKDKSEAPSGFSMKLRKHIRQRRLLSVRQFGEDRVVDFCFGLYDKPESEFHIILELYAAGNVVLTDHEYKVLSLIRVFKDDEVRFTVGASYTEALRKHQDASIGTETLPMAEWSGSALQTALRAVVQQIEDKQRALAEAAADAAEEGAPGKPQQGQQKKKRGGGGKAKKSPALNLKHALSARPSPVNGLGPDLIEHCICQAGLARDLAVDDALLNDMEKLEHLAATLRTESADIHRRLDDLDQLAGYLLLEPSNGESDSKFYTGFEPVLLAQHGSVPHEAFDSFNAAVDEYFSKIDAQRQEKAALAQQRQAAKKVESIKADQARRVEQLKVEVVRKELGARAIEENVQMVDNALLIVRSAVASGMGWDDLSELIAAEKAKANPIALLIAETHLETNEISLRLDAPQTASPEERRACDPDGKVLVRVDINESAFANVSALYTNKKQAVSKAERTITASEKVLEDAERKFRKDMERHDQNRQRVRVQRKINWFEKFRWFITSEGFLVLSGRDAQQNEMLVKKFLRKSHGDVYVHADVHGASSCIVRSPRPGVQIPPESLRQAGAMTVCLSSAWASKIIISAWWVRADQVSKTAPSGEYLSTGSFMIRGKKNYLPPCRLELVFGFLFKLDETQESYDERAVEWRALEHTAGDASDAEDSGSNDDASGDDSDGGNSDDLAKGGQAEIIVAAPQTAKGRRAKQIKKGGGPNGSQAPPTVRKTKKGKNGSGANGSAAAAAADEAASTGATSSATMRRKRAKQKKIKKKYGDQTEEERRLAMIALGHKMPEPSADSPPPAPNRATVADEEDRGDLASNGGSVQQPGCDETASAAGGEEAETEAPAAGTASTDEIGSSETVGTDTADAEAEAGADAGDDDNLGEKDGDDAADSELNLKSFTCNPQPDDVLLYAIPFCAPPQAANNYKYRVKLVPGALKKGKAGRQSLEVSLRLPSGSERERELLRAIPETEIMQAMQGGVKIMAPGVNNTSKAAKAAKQAKRIKKPRK